MTQSLQTFLLWLTPVLFAANLVQSFFYLPEADRREGGEHMPHWLYYICLSAFFGSMMFAIVAPTLPLLWVAVELTTLTSAPLIAYHRTPDALEAMWKYLLICSIGIGLALFGTMLVMHAETIRNVMWFKAGFAVVLAGYGTKMGLAPFHTWLPDAHSEAPAPVSALLSGALLNCSFLAIVRVRELMPAEAAPFCDGALLALGLLSVAVAAVFMVRQTDYKRLLAYSSVEHMGLLAIIFVFALQAEVIYSMRPIIETALVGHIVAHSLTKTALFQTAGNLLLAFGTRTIAAVQGLGVSLRGHAALWIIGTLLICGMPPSILFLTELNLVLIAPLWVSALVLVLLFIVFAAMSRVMLAMTMGKPVAQPKPLPKRISIIPWILTTLLVLFGVLFSLACFFM